MTWTSVYDELTRRGVMVVSDTLHWQTLSMNLSTPLLSATALSSRGFIDFVQSGEEGSLAESEVVDYYVWLTVKRLVQESGEKAEVVNSDDLRSQFLVEIARGCYDRVQGPHITFLPPRVQMIGSNANVFGHDDPGANGHERDTDTVVNIVKDATRLFRRLEAAGLERGDILISISATERGIIAAKLLQQNHVQVNLVGVSGFSHAVACFDSGASAISLSISDILDAHRQPLDDLDETPGLIEISCIQEYVKRRNVPTQVLATHFPSVQHICAIGDFDAVCLSKSQIDDLKRTEAPTPTTRGFAGGYNHGYEDQVRRRVEDVLFPTRLREGSKTKIEFAKGSGTTRKGSLDSLLLHSHIAEAETARLNDAMDKITRKLELEFKYTYYLPLIKIEELETDFFEEREVIGASSGTEKRRRIRLR